MKSILLTQKQKTVISFSLLILFIAAAPIIAHAGPNNGLQQVADNVDKQVNGLAVTVKKIGFGLGTVFAVISLISKYMKTGTDSENSGKAYTSWFVGIALFSIAMGVIGMFMQ